MAVPHCTAPGLPRVQPRTVGGGGDHWRPPPPPAPPASDTEDKRLIKAIQQNEVTPLCPHCSEEIDEIWFREVPTTFGRRYLYFCAKCRKVLGISHRKGNMLG